MTTSTVSKVPSWDAADYAANSVQQQSWAQEQIAKLTLKGDEHILDVGCGDGKITAQLARVIPRGSATGIDASPDMIAFAQKTFSKAKIPNLEFHRMDAREIRFPEKQFDLIFSNAALHWIDDHETFLRGASSCLKSGGRVVVSCGGKGNAQDIFVALRPLMRTKRWREFFRKIPKPYFFYSPDDYQKWLPRHGFKARRVQLAPKDATNQGRAGFAAVLRTTWLPYTQRVPESMREEFIQSIVDRYLDRHPPDADDLVHVRMVRLEIDAIKV